MASMWDDDEPDWFNDDENDEEAEGNEDGSGDIPGSLHCLVLLDCGAPGMFEPSIPDPEYPEDMISPMDYALKAAEETVRDKIRTTVTLHTGRRDAFGVLLYGTRYRMPLTTQEEEAKGEDIDEDDMMETTEHEFLPLQPPGVSTVRKIREAEDDVIQGRRLDLQKEYEPVGGNQLQQNSLQLAIFEAQRIFDTCKFVRKVKAGEMDDLKQIWIFTTNDNPCTPEAWNVVQKQFSDAQENGIDIVVWPLPRKEPFDYSLFYDKVHARSPMQNSEGETLQDMLADMQHSWKKPRRAFPVPLLLPDWRSHQNRPGLAMDVYRLVQTGKVPAKVQVHQETGRMLSRIRQKLAANGGGQVLAESRPNSTKQSLRDVALESRWRSFATFGKERVPVSEDDKIALKKAANANSEFASLILLGFRDKNSIPVSHRLEQAYYCYPSDERTEGSKLAFAHLHASMKRKGVLAIGELLSRVTATSRLVAMYPLEDEVGPDSEDNYTGPPGMMILSLPFEDECRVFSKDAAALALENGGADLASEKVVDAAMKLITKQSYGEDAVIGQRFENAYLTKFWDYVEHVALEQALPGNREFDTIVNQKLLAEEVGKEVEELLANLPEDIVPEKVPRKRKIVPDDSGVDWATVFAEDRVHDCKNAELQAKLRSIGEKVGGRKHELVDRLMKHLAAEFASAKVKKEDNVKVEDGMI